MAQALTAALGACNLSLGDEPARERDVVAAEVPSEETGREGDHGTGDWGGLRTRLVARGVHLHAGYAGEVLANVSGGLRRGAIYEGLLELGLDLDTEKLGLWSGGNFRATSLNPHGPVFSSRYAGDVLTASNIEAYDSMRLYELWYEHKFWAERFSIRAGQLIADDEFAFTDAGSLFLNSAFGWPAFISGNVLNTGPAFFVAAPGVRMRLDASEALYFQAGIYDGDSFDDPNGSARVNRSGMHIRLAPEQGAFVLAETGYRWNSATNEAGLPGVAKLGAWLHTANFASNYYDENGGQLAVTSLGAELHEQTFGAYIAAEQLLWREGAGEEQGLWLFARAGGAPRDRALFEFAMDFGFQWAGPFPGRDEDKAGLGFVHARISRDLRAFEKLDAETNGARYEAFSDHESVLEAFYHVQLTKWWSLQPDLQWIFHPGGSTAIPDALVIGVRTSIVF